MMAHPSRQALLAWSVAFAVAAGASGCNRAQAPTSPATGTAQPAAPVHPSIVGTVVISTTHKPSPLGGLVYLENGPKQPGALMKAHVIIRHKDFIPFISVLAPGGTATFDNKDPMPHHIFSPDVPGWDTGFLKHGHPAKKTFNKLGRVTLLCNIHQEMLGYLYVIPSTSFGRVDAQGKYAVGNVPPGTYKVTAWVPHEVLATQTATVSAGAPVTLNFTLTPSHDKR